MRRPSERTVCRTMQRELRREARREPTKYSGQTPDEWRKLKRKWHRRLRRERAEFERAVDQERAKLKAGNGFDDRASRPASEGWNAGHLDYCFVSPSMAGRVRSSHVDMDAAGSDHQPVWVDIDL